MDNKKEELLQKDLSKYNDIDAYNKFPERLRTCRKKYNLTQDDTAKLIGVSRENYNKWESIDNYSMPTLLHLSKISKLFEVSIDYLLGETDFISDEQKNAGELLGLSPASIQFLHSIRHESISGTLDYLLANHYGDFSNMLSNYTKSLFHFNASNAASVKFDGKLDPKEIEEIKEEYKTYSDASILEVMHILQFIRDNMIYDSYRANRNMHEALYEELKNKE